MCVCPHTHTHTERFIYLRFFVSFLSESSFFYRKLPFWLFLVDRGTWQYVGRPRSDELWRRQHPQCPSPLASSSITHSAHSPPTGTRQKNNKKRRWVYRSLAATTGLFFLNTPCGFLPVWNPDSNPILFFFWKKKKWKEKINSRTWRNSHWPCLSRSAHTVLSLGPKSGSWKQSEQQSGYPFSLFSFFFLRRGTENIFFPLQNCYRTFFFIYRLPFIDWQQYVTKNIN